LGPAGLYEHAQRPTEGPLPPELESGVLAVNVASETVVTRALEDAVRAGKLQKAGEKAGRGGFPGYFADPDGYLREVAFNPSFPVNSDGLITIR